MNTPNQSFELFSNINSIQNSFNPQTPRMQYYSFFPNLSDTQTNSPSQAQVNINDQLTNEEENREPNVQNNAIKTDTSTNSITNETPKPRIVNVVSMVDLGCPLNLREIASKCVNAEYNPARINAVIMRLKNPKTAALIFNTGILICTGANNEIDSKIAAKRYAKSIRSLGYEVKFKNFKIINIVATCDVGFNIHLTKLNLKIAHSLGKTLKGDELKEKISYEPQIFPGLIYRMDKPKLAILVFASGKVNIVGAKERDEVYKAIEKMYPTKSLTLKNKINQGLKVPIYIENEENGENQSMKKFEEDIKQFVIDNNIYRDEDFDFFIEELVKQNKNNQKITRNKIKEIN